MEIIRGKHASFLSASALAEQLAAYERIHIDLGTGDGYFVRTMAKAFPNCLAIGIDTCRENLRDFSRRAPANTLFVIANAQALPSELHGFATHVTINFPWGSLLEGLLTDDPALQAGLMRLMRPNAVIEIRLNGGALARFGWSLEEGASRVRQMLAMNGLNMRTPLALSAPELKSCPTTWAKRLAFGRDPRGMYLRGTRRATALVSGAVPWRATTSV